MNSSSLSRTKAMFSREMLRTVLRSGGSELLATREVKWARKVHRTRSGSLGKTPGRE